VRRFLSNYFDLLLQSGAPDARKCSLYVIVSNFFPSVLKSTVYLYVERLLGLRQVKTSDPTTLIVS